MNLEYPFGAAHPKSLAATCEKAKALRFTHIAYAPVGITMTIDEFIRTLADGSPDEREYAIYGHLIIHLPDAWHEDAEIYELS